MIWKIIFTVLLAVGGSWLWSFLCFMGYHKLHYNHQPGPCHLVKGIDNGSEDMELVSGSLALITSGVRSPSKQEPPGEIMMFDFDKPDQEATAVPIEGNLDKISFNPHGISVWKDPEIGTTYVFVVNHLPGKEAVERFEFISNRRVLLHLETITDNTGNIRLLNDVSAVGPNSFYYTNFQYTFHWLEVYAQFYWGSIGFYNGKNARIVSKGYLQPNGHHLSKDQRLLYVGHIGGRSILVFERQPDDGLKLLQEYSVLTSCDNLDISADGQYLWAGCVRAMWLALIYVESPTTKISPSQVMRFTLDKDGLIKGVVEVFSDNGKFFKGSSSAIPYKDAMLVGSVHSNALYCKVNSL